MINQIKAGKIQKKRNNNTYKNNMWRSSINIHTLPDGQPKRVGFQAVFKPLFGHMSPHLVSVSALQSFGDLSSKRLIN